MVRREEDLLSPNNVEACLGMYWLRPRKNVSVMNSVIVACIYRRDLPVFYDMLICRAGEVHVVVHSLLVEGLRVALKTSKPTVNRKQRNRKLLQ